MSEIKMAFDPTKLRLVDPKTLTLDPKNRNKHPPAQIERFCKLLQTYGMRWPILVSERSGVIKAGEGRLLAALKLGMPQVLVSYQEFEDETIEYGFGISDNAIAAWAELDLSAIHTDIGDLGPFDVDLLGLDGFVVEPAEKFEAQCDEDEVPAPPTESMVKPGDLWQLGRHRLMCGDSTSIDAVEALMGGEKADMVFTDPPYNIDYSSEDRPIGDRARSKNKLGRIENDKMSDDSFYSFLLGVNSTIIIACREGAPIYQCAPIGMNNLQYLKAWSDIGFHYSDGLIWLKNNHSISRKDYHPKHEVIHYGWTAGSHSWYGDRNKFSVFECSREKVTDYKHPTQKPIELSEHFIGNSSKQNNTVLDLFGGSGSTLIACEKTNRRCFMMELDPHYCSVIIERWQNYTGQHALRIGE